MTPPAEPIPPVELRLLSQPRYLLGAREFVSGVAKRLGFDDRSAGQIALAVDEALTNVIRHGYQRCEDGRIWLKIWPMTSEGSGQPAGIRIVIEDECPQVEPGQIRSRDLEDVRPGGLGVHLISELMDTASYEQRETTGMRLTMTRALPSPDHQDQANEAPQDAPG